MKNRLHILVASLALLPSLASALDLTGGNTVTGGLSSANGFQNNIPGQYNWASGYQNTVNGNFNNVFGYQNMTTPGNLGTLLLNGALNNIGGYANTVFGNTNTVANGSVANFVTGYQHTIGATAQFLSVGGAFNSASGVATVLYGTNILSTSNFSALFGQLISDGGHNGSVMFSDHNALGVRTTSNRFTSAGVDTFNAVFNNGYFLHTNDGQGTNPNAGLYIIPSSPNTVSTSFPARVGINTITLSPGATMEVVDERSVIQATSIGGIGSGGHFFGKSANGTAAAPTATTTGNELAGFRGSGHDGSSFRATRGAMSFFATQNWTGSAQGTELRVSTTPNGSTTLSERMRITHDGRVGIGTTTPTKGKLEINGFGPLFAHSGYFYVASSGTGSTGPGNTGDCSLYASGAIYASAFAAFSDERIKRVDGRSDGARDLATLAGIEVTDYSFIDTVAKGDRPQKKIIAQQVETVYPQAVSRTTEAVPDIYEKATVEEGWVQLATDLKVGDRVRLIGENEEGIHEVLEVRENAFRTAFQPETDNVFVYGREVNDFRIVDYEAISMLNVSATQELARKLEARDAAFAKLSAENAAMAKKLAALEARDTAREARLARLEQSLDDRAVRTVSASLDLKTAGN